MARLALTSAFARAFGGLFHGAPNRRARRALGWNASSTRPAVSSRRRVRPCLETLEDRITPSTAANATDLANVIQQDNANNTADTIVLTGGANAYQLTGQIEITDKNGLTIEGQGQAIDAFAANNRAFLIDKGGTNVVFQNLTIEGGRATDNGTGSNTDADGGGILDYGGNVKLSNVVLENCHAEAGVGFNANGGGIYVSKAGSLTIKSSILQDDRSICSTTSSPGNGGSAEGGGVYTSGSATIADSTLSDNQVIGESSSGDGQGGIALGGGIFAGGQTDLSDSALSANRVIGGNSEDNAGGEAEGGGILAVGQTTITDCTLSGNTLTGGNGSVSNNPSLAGKIGGIGGFAGGGGVYAESQTTITASSLSYNTLTGGNGSFSQKDVTVSDDVGGDVEGGAVFASAPVSISLSNLSNNALTGGKGTETGIGPVTGSLGGSASGGGLYVLVGTTVLDSILSGNTVTGGSGSFFGGNGKPGLAKGGGADFLDATNTLVNSTIADNQVIGGQGLPVNPVASGGGLFFGQAAAATLTNDTVADNQASPAAGGSEGTSGGGIDNSSGGTITLVNTLVARNSLESATNSGPDYNGAVTNSDHNLIGNDAGSTGFSATHGDLLGSTLLFLNPDIGQLTNNGGTLAGAPGSQQVLPTIALLPGSLAINAGDNNAVSTIATAEGVSPAAATDERGPGFARVLGGAIDIGAFEVHPPPPPSSNGGASTTTNPPPTLHTPPLLAFFDALLGGVETINSNDTETVTDSLFGILLFVSTYDGSGNLMSVTIFGIDVTFLFESTL